MSSRKKKPASIFAYMMKILAIGLLAILAGGVLVLAVPLFDIFGILKVPVYPGGPNLSKIEKQIEASDESDYSGIDTSVLGEKGYFEILDSGGRILYTGKNTGKKSYAPYMIKYIPETDHSIYIDFSEFVDNGENMYLLSIQNYDNKDEKKKGNLVQIFKEDGSIVFSSDNGDSSKISAEEFSYIKAHADVQFGRFYGKKMVREKKVFKSPDGDERAAIFHFESPYVQYKKEENRVYHIRNTFIVIYLIYILLVILIATVTFYRKLKKPLITLKTALEEVTTGKKVEVDSEVETREISQVLDAFNSMEDRLEKMDAEREKAREERNTALADISHDLKTPITVIGGYADALRDGIIPMEDSHRYLDIISQKAKTMSELITQFSDYSRFENPKFKISREKGDLAEYLRAYMAKRFNELSVLGFQVDTDIPEEQIPFDFDQSQMKRVFENIISNSVKYTKPGTVIYVSMKCDDRTIEIIMGDNGPGVSPELKSKLFEPFTVGDQSRKSGKGTGLGLSIAKKIVEAHGGTIEPEDEIDGKKGLYYRICFPK
jgi:signal transduction histidine kinase